jgi:hypothetical protein
MVKVGNKTFSVEYVKGLTEGEFCAKYRRHGSHEERVNAYKVLNAKLEKPKPKPKAKAKKEEKEIG